jgi:threonine synthase
VQSGDIRPEEEVVVFNTGAAQKYPETVKLDLPQLDKDKPIDYAALIRP